MRYISAKDIVLKKRRSGSHKGENGRLLIIGGSEDYAGASALAGLAALRTGCDIVVIAAPEKAAWAINCMSPDLITKKIRGKEFKKRHVKEMLKLAEDFDAVLIGNGIGRRSDDFVKEFVKKVKKEMVIDADAIKALSLKYIEDSIITPHRKEFDILLKNSKIDEKELQDNVGSNVVLLKGKVDKIVKKGKIFYNKTGNSSMTVGGTGDVLAGLCAGFLSQGYTKEKSACYAAYLNGKVGDEISKNKGYSLIASDIIASDIIKDFKKINIINKRSIKKKKR